MNHPPITVTLDPETGRLVVLVTTTGEATGPWERES